MIPLDEALRPRWLFGATVHEGCDRAGYYEQGDFASLLEVQSVANRSLPLTGPGQVCSHRTSVDTELSSQLAMVGPFPIARHQGLDL